MAVERYCIAIEGVLQGVGFRPFVYRLAQDKALSGWMANNSQGVQIEIQGEELLIREFLHELKAKKPQWAEIHNLQISSAALTATRGFTIRESMQSGNVSALVPPDLAPCDECLRDIFDPLNRRYQYPFTNCSNCGPRFSIIEHLPYDRTNTAMKQFPLCGDCQQEYENPLDRRFHAEPTACPNCGPKLQLCDPGGQMGGEMMVSQTGALEQAAQAILSGLIVAVKGVGGFHLLADATNTTAIARLREKKQRHAKPFALLYPNIETVQQHCLVSDSERDLLVSPRRPIVLLVTKDRLFADAEHDVIPGIAPNIAPGNPDLGIMLPCSPLHYLLMSRLQRPIIATSGNIAGEPICITNDQAMTRLGAIADLFLLHDRPIVRPVDDSVVRVINGVAMMLRHGRGYAPLLLRLPEAITTKTGNIKDNKKDNSRSRPQADLLAVGGQLKSTVAVARNNRVYLSQHIGDLGSRRSQSAFEQAIVDLAGFYSIEPETVIHDQHPGYTSTEWAQLSGKKCIAVQHHVAHFFSCMAEQRYAGPALGVSWDGSGYGPGGTIRGGEFLYWDGEKQLSPVATLRSFPLPGAEQAIREPRRQAAGLLYALFGDEAFTVVPALWERFSSSEKHNLARMLSRQLNSPLSSSAGRLFDAVAALLGITTINDFEGQAAMALEFIARPSDITWHFPFEILPQDDAHQSGKCLVDWKPMIMSLLKSKDKAVPLADIAAAFHNTLAHMIVAVTQKVSDCPVFLSGGVFQNRRLSETVAALLHQNNRQVYGHQRVPPNDGGLALGQIYFTRCMEDNKPCV